jgi:hypothetical protein
MSFDAHAKSPDAPVAKRIPSYMLPKKKSLAQKPTPRPTPEIEIKSKAVKRKCRLGSKTSRSSTISTSSSVTKVDDAQGESKIEVMQSSVSRINELMYDADNPHSPNAVKDDVPEERGMAALPTQVR